MADNTVLIYQTSDARKPFEEWLYALKDWQAFARIQTRIARLALGNAGDYRALEDGIFEMRIDWGPGYRIYYAQIGPVILLLLSGGDKTTQQRISTMPKATLKTTKRERIAVPPSVPYEAYLLEQLKDPEAAAAYIEAAIDEGDQAVLMLALRHVAQARGGVSEIARKSKLTREATYRMLSKSGNPELRSLTAILGAAGLRLSVKPIGKQAA